MDPLKHRPRVATVWLGGCSGCHMSFLDMDERLLELAAKMDLVYSPFIDAKTFPEHVDVALVEGAVANVDHLRLIALVRAHADVLVAFGDCAVTGNVTAMRNPLKTAAQVLRRSYGDATAFLPADETGPLSHAAVPALLDTVRTVRDCVRVDLYLPGCPPPADVIYDVLSDLLAGRTASAHNRARLG